MEVLVNGVSYPAYEVKDISTTQDVEQAYREAVAQNCKYYRAVSKKGFIYGWSGTGILKQENNDGWFVNANYVEPVVEEPTDDLDDLDETIEPVKEHTEEPAKEPAEQPTEEITEEPKEELPFDETVEEPTDGENYKLLYENAQSEIESLRAELNAMAEEFEAYRTKFNEYQETIHKFADLLRG